MKFNVVTGLPRSGSTLLCNILNQNPDFYASSTSILPILLANMSHVLSNSPEVKGDLALDEKSTNDRLLRTLRGVVNSWYNDKKKLTVFDKSRVWAVNALMLKQLFPRANIIVTVRDLRSVFASVEKQHLRNPILDPAQQPLEKTIYARADGMFGPQGLIGGPIVGIEDLIRRKPKGIVVIAYEALAMDPTIAVDTLYQKIGAKPFKHNFDNIENTATDLDALYLGKFEHKGDGAVVEPDPKEWQRYIAPDLAQAIVQRYPFYNQTFGYIQ